MTGITLALLILGAFGIIMVHAGKFSQIVRENVEIQVYLHKTVTENQRSKIKQELLSKAFLAVKENQPAIQFISKEEAAQSFIDDTGEDFFSILDNNPLHDAFIINVKPEYIEEAKMKRIKKDLEGISGVFEAHYVENLVKDINSNIQKAGIILFVLFLLFLFTSVILINNTIKLALFSQRFLIRSMQLVGAKPWFIQRPFLLRASLHGLFSGFIASLLIIVLLYYSYREIEDLKMLYDQESLIIVFSSILIVGMVIGFSSSFRAINKYLKMSLDELY
ncbi:ABC transporter permease [Hyphobacterium sp. CCMP332]|nr:ABC transporter permease [Hyphobacterium sp. CCMP332]